MIDDEDSVVVYCHVSGDDLTININNCMKDS